MRMIALKHWSVALIAVPFVGCIQLSSYRYLSFEEAPGVKVVSIAPIEAENVAFESKIPVKYSLERQGYSILITLNTQEYLPNATIEVSSSSAYRLVPRPWRGAREGRERPCGSYDELVPSGESFVFSWVICRNDAGPEEMVVAFDVIEVPSGVIHPEVIPFRLKQGGFFWLKDDL